MNAKLVHPPPTDAKRPRKLNVLFISLYTQMGGGEFSILHQMKNLDRVLFNPILIAPAEGALTQKLEELGIRVKIVPFPVVPLRDLIRPRIAKSFVQSAFALRRALIEMNVDLIQCSDVLALLLLVPFLVTKPVPVVFSIIFFYERLRAWILNMLAPLFVPAIVVDSKMVRDD